MDRMILSLSSSFVLLNGVPGKSFKCHRGLRQGDPLSPLLFVNAADLLQTIINAAWHNGVLKHPISDNFGGDFPIIQYADDTLLILPVDARTLFNLKGLLRSFSDSMSTIKTPSWSHLMLITPNSTTLPTLSVALLKACPSPISAFL